MTISAEISVKAKLATERLNLFYGSFHAVKGLSIRIEPNAITAIIGPSGCGKSTLLRSFNRMNDAIRGFRFDGKILLDGRDIYDPSLRSQTLRKRVGMVFQRPNPFPLSVFENVAYGPKVHAMAAKEQLNAIVEKSLAATGLWKELKDRLRVNALSLSPEQQQRICISRLLAVEPDVLLMDEPCSALDPIATARVEELLQELKMRYTIVIVTHNMQQATRASDYAAFLLLGELVESGATDQLFTAPLDSRTEQYITGRFG